MIYTFLLLSLSLLSTFSSHSQINTFFSDVATKVFGKNTPKGSLEEVRKGTLRNKDDALLMIASIHNKVFGKGNLLTEKITSAESDEWNKLVNYSH